MKAILIVALLALTASAALTDNQCFMDKAGSALVSVANTVKGMTNFESLDQYENIMTQVASLKVAYEACNINTKTHTNGVSVLNVLENLGVGNLLLSQCTQDLGGFFLILESIAEDPTDILSDVLLGIFTLLYGQKSYEDCGQFVAFLLQL